MTKHNIKADTIKWRMIKNVDDIKLYEFRIDKVNSFYISEYNPGKYASDCICKTFFNDYMLKEYSSLRTAKNGVENLISKIAQRWHDVNN